MKPLYDLIFDEKETQSCALCGAVTNELYEVNYLSDIIPIYVCRNCIVRAHKETDLNKIYGNRIIGYHDRRK